MLIFEKYIYIDIDKKLIALKAKNAEKMINVNLSLLYDKINLRIISKPHAYLQTKTKTQVKFRKNWYKNCRRSCAHNVSPVHSHCYR